MVAVLSSFAGYAQRQATATATVSSGFVAGIAVTDGGAGYSTAPGVTIAGGSGSGATAKAELTGDAVSQIIVLTAGSGYLTSPDVIIALPDLQPSILSLKMVPQLTVYGAVGSTTQVQWVNEFGDTNAWTILTNVVLTSNPMVFYDTILPSGPKRFYRAIAQGGTRPTAPAGFVWLPAGQFTMGSPETEQDRGSDEGPQTMVTLTTGFYICSHPVTQGEYLALIGSNPSVFVGDLNRPVEEVSWVDATNYCAVLSAQERSGGRLPAGYAYTLPTEAQWEYAARAGTSTRFSFGDDPGYTMLGDYAWYTGNSSNTTHPVATKHPNPWALYDMSGNVWEWCADWFGPYPGGSVLDPSGPVSGLSRVGRGGGLDYDGQFCRSANRDLGDPAARFNDRGFRVVLVSVPSP